MILATSLHIAHASKQACNDAPWRKAWCGEVTPPGLGYGWMDGYCMFTFWHWNKVSAICVLSTRFLSQAFSKNGGGRVHQRVSLK